MKGYILLIFQLLLIFQYLSAKPTAPTKVVLRERKGGNVIYGHGNRVDIGTGQNREGHNTIYGDKNYVDVEELKAKLEKLAKQQTAHQAIKSSRKMKDFFEAIQKSEEQNDINVKPKIANNPKCIKRTVLSRRKRGGNIIQGYGNRVDLNGGQDDYDKKLIFSSGQEFKTSDDDDYKADDSGDDDRDESKILNDHGLLPMNSVSKLFSSKNILSNGFGAMSQNFAKDNKVSKQIRKNLSNHLAGTSSYDCQYEN